MTFEMERSGVVPRTAKLRSAHARGRARNGSRALLAAMLIVGMLGAPSVGFAGETAKETGREGGLGAAAALSSLVYGPVKLVYATGGLIVGAFAWAFTAGDTQVAEKVFTRSLRGNYVVTPDHLTGERELVFIGRDVAEVESEQAPAVASAAPSQTTAQASETAGNTASSTASNTASNGGYDDMGW